MMDSTMNIDSVVSHADEDGNSNLMATIDGQIMSVPLDLANRHYQAILDHINDGGGAFGGNIPAGLQVAADAKSRDSEAPAP